MTHERRFQRANPQEKWFWNLTYAQIRQIAWAIGAIAMAIAAMCNVEPRNAWLAAAIATTVLFAREPVQ